MTYYYGLINLATNTVIEIKSSIINCDNIVAQEVEWVH